MSLLLFYLPSLNLGLYADDYHSWNAVAREAHRPIAELFFKTYNPEFYRPFEFLLIRANEALFGYEPYLYRAAAVLGHLLTCLAVVLLAVRLRLGRAAGLLAAIFFGVHPTNAMAVLSNDAANQVWFTLFGLLCLAALVRRDGVLKARNIAASAGFLLLSMLWKDAGTGFLVAAGLLIFLAGGKSSLAKKTLSFLPLVFVFLLYIAIRTHAGVIKPVFGYQFRYELWFGQNLFANPGLMLLSMQSPVGSTFLLASGSYRNPAVALGVLSGALLIYFLAVGLYRFQGSAQANRRSFLLLLALFFVSFFPDILLAHASELYTYKTAAFLALLFGAAAVELLETAALKNQKNLRAVLAVFLAVLLVFFAFSTKDKERLMRANAERCDAYLRAVKNQVPEIGDSTAVVLANEKEGGRNYSIYFMPGVYVFGGTHALEKLYGRKLPVYLIVEKDRIESTCRTLRGDCLAVLARADDSIEAGYIRREPPEK